MKGTSEERGRVPPIVAMEANLPPPLVHEAATSGPSTPPRGSNFPLSPASSFSLNPEAPKPAPPLQDASLCAEDQAVLLAPFNYICEVKGKEIRTAFITAFNEWLKVSKDTCEVINRISQGLHNASLLIDDIEDDSRLRRGRPSAHLIYGMPITINCANHVYFLALQEVLSLQNSVATDVFVRELISLHQGQGLDIHWRDNSQCPTLEEYEDMVLKKTGGLFRLSLGLMQAFSEDKRDITGLLNNMAFLFQVLDDYLNLQSQEYYDNKTYAEDLTEGKFSFPIIWAIQESSKKGDQRLMGMLKTRPTDMEVKRYAIQYMESLGAFAYTREVLEQRHAAIQQQIEEFGGNPGLSAIMQALMGKMTSATATPGPPGSPTLGPTAYGK